MLHFSYVYFTTILKRTGRAERKKNMLAMCLNPDALQMLLLLLFFSIDGLASHYGRKLKHLVCIILTCL